ncbi:hypothetical protein D3C86_2175980 [compost metagenome]
MPRAATAVVAGSWKAVLESKMERKLSAPATQKAKWTLATRSPGFSRETTVPISR